MSNVWKAVIVAVVVALVVGVIILKRPGAPSPTDSGKSSVTAAALPKLIDLGSVNCIPCKAMAPILEELKRDYAGKLTVEFIDVVNVNPEAGERYGIKLIPTQIFFDASGREIFRHEGYISKQDILAKFSEAGINIGR